MSDKPREYPLANHPNEATDLLRMREHFNGGALFDALHQARNAIASLDREALGMGGVDAYPDPPYPIRDELLATIDNALSLLSPPLSTRNSRERK